MYKLLGYKQLNNDIILIAGTYTLRVYHEFYFNKNLKSSQRFYL